MSNNNYNKKRNTLFLYEVLILQLTKSVINGDDQRRNVVSSLIREHFKKGTELYNDWQLHKSLLSLKKDSKIADKILNEVKRMYGFVNQDALFREQSVLISKVNKILGQEAFSAFVPNYKSLANIHQLLNNKNLNPRKRVMLEEELLKSEDVSLTEKYVPVPQIVLKKFVEKFNNKYSSLLQEQKDLLQRYVFSDERNVELKYFLNEEIGKLKQIVTKSLTLKEVVEDHDMKEKINSVISLLESFSSIPIDQVLVEKVLKIQELCKELQQNGD